MEKKYEILDETEPILYENSPVLHRIRALRDFGNVKKGDIGGWIEKEDNLSHDGNCWVYDDANVYGDAKVFENARIYGHAAIRDYVRVYGNAEVFGYSCVVDNAIISGCAKVFEDATVCDRAHIYENANIHGHAEVFGCAEVSGNADIYERAKVYGHADISSNVLDNGNVKVHGHACITDSVTIFGDSEISCDMVIHGDGIFYNAHISSVCDLLYVGPIAIANNNYYITFYKNEDNDIMVHCAWFNDTIDKFEEHVRETYRCHLIQFLDVINFARKKFC